MAQLRYHHADDMAVVWSPLRVGSMAKAKPPDRHQQRTHRSVVARSRELRPARSGRESRGPAVVEPLPEALGAGCTSCSRARGRRPRRSGRRCRRGHGPADATAPGRSIVAGRGEVNAVQSFFASDRHSLGRRIAGLRHLVVSQPRCRMAVRLPNVLLSQPDFRPIPTPVRGAPAAQGCARTTVLSMIRYSRSASSQQC